MPELEEQPHQTAIDQWGLRFKGLTAYEVVRQPRTVGAPAVGDIDPAEDIHLSEQWNLACRVAASRGLSKSALLPRFLLYICEQTLKGNERLLTEQRIGTAIFNRAADYNPGEDNIVRSYARTLRRRLDEYFEAEGINETMRIVIPRGGYVPAFEWVTSRSQVPSKREALPQVESLQLQSSLPAVEDGPAKSSKPHLKSILRTPWVTALCGLFAGLLLAFGIWLALRGAREKQMQSPSHPIWAEMFQQNRNTLIVPADSGLGILQNLTGHLIPLEEYANGSYFSDTRAVPGIDVGNLADLRQQRYTSVVDLNITTRIMQLPEIAAGRTQVRFARSITTEDLKTSNVILLGSVHSNPWVALFEDKLNFRLKYMPEVDQSYVWDGRPMGTEQKQYLNGTGQMANHTYGVIDYLPNLDGNGHVLIIQGLNMAATQAAADTLFNSDAMKPILQQAARSNGSLRPFELLIKTSSIGATDPSLQIIATRFYS